MSSNAIATATRKITVVATRGKKQVIEFSGSKWSELEQLLSQNGISTANSKCADGETKVSFEHPDAEIPAKDMYLFIMPRKNKSGATAKKAAPKKAVKKAAPKKAAAKKVAKKAAPKKAKAKADKIEPAEEVKEGVAEIVEAVKASKEPFVLADPEAEMKKVANGFADVKPSSNW